MVRRARRLIVDVLLSATACALVFWLPVHFAIGHLGATHLVPSYFAALLAATVLFSAVSLGALLLFRTSRMVWRYVSFNDLLGLVGAAVLSVTVFTILDVVLFGRMAPGYVGIAVWRGALLLIVNVALLALPRLVMRWVHEVRLPTLKISHGDDTRIPALLAGPVTRMEAFIRESLRDPAARYRIVGALTDEPRMLGNYIQGVMVMGRISALVPSVQELRRRGVRPEMLILTNGELDNTEVEKHLKLASEAKLKVSRVPVHGVVEDLGKIRPLELSDLLGRPEVMMDTGGIAAMVAGKRILVTGAGGSIGIELCRQVASYGPSLLVIADFGEFNLYSIDRELSENFPHLKLETVLVDVRDGEMVSSVMERLQPQIVFHAAALKHVPLLESHPIEAVKTNVIGTINVAESCVRHGVSAMVTISTDKAVHPTNVMGATKRLAESYCQGLDQSDGNTNTKFVTVRFGNVLGSAGSVVPLFQRQIEAGVPITITHPEITRFFMTIPEAVLLVLQAGVQGTGAKHTRGNIYVLEMGKAVKIIDLAHQMIQLSGKRPGIDIEIKVVGLRPGEKLYEEVAYGDEAVLPTDSRAIMQLAPRVTDLRIIRQQVQELRTACTARDIPRVMRLIKISVPEFKGEPTSRAASS